MNWNRFEILAIEKLSYFKWNAAIELWIRIARAIRADGWTWIIIDIYLSHLIASHKHTSEINVDCEFSRHKSSKFIRSVLCFFPSLSAFSIWLKSPLTHFIRNVNDKNYNHPHTHIHHKKKPTKVRWINKQKKPAKLFDMVYQSSEILL